MPITPLTLSSPAGQAKVAALGDRFQEANTSCRKSVTEIMDAVRARGDDALLEYTRKFDSPAMTRAALRVSEQEMSAARTQVEPELLTTLERAYGRIYDFHLREKEQSWMVTRDDGTITGRLVRPVDSAGLYVPGGQGGATPLVSSVLMNGIPAAIAGVDRRVMVTPADKNGAVNPALLVAAGMVGIDEVYKTGSAWAIAALAFGTQSIAPVDVIVGPGNQFVTEAKRQVSGRVRIDMIAGPSEVLIVADQSADPAYIAADMLAQAEHDPQALAMVITTDNGIGQAIVAELNRQLPLLSRSSIAATALRDRGVILVADTLQQAIEHANLLAAEHLELMIRHPFAWLGRIRHAGAIFVGRHTPESAGDYMAGPNHVLPTMGTARFSSALGVETFIKKSSLIAYTEPALAEDSEHIQRLANLEGLTAHARSTAIRREPV